MKMKNEKLIKEVEQRIDGLEFEIEGKNIAVEYDGGVLGVVVSGKTIFYERVDHPCFEKNLVCEISRLLNHHSRFEGMEILEEVDEKIYEVLEGLDF